MAKGKHSCTDSEHIARLAADNGFFQWETLWNESGDVKNKRKPNVLYKSETDGDTVEIPDKGEKTESCTADDPPPTCVFEVPTYKLFLRLRILKEDFAPVKQAAYELDFDDDPNLQLEPDSPKRINVDGKELPLEGKTDDNGLIERQIPVSLAGALLIVRVKAEDTDKYKEKGDKSKAVRGDVPIRWQLQVGKLNPVKEQAPDQDCFSGVQQRLNNLAANAGQVDGKDNPQVAAALATFQKLYKLADKEGRPESNTQKKLYDVHDGPILVPPP